MKRFTYLFFTFLAFGIFSISCNCTKKSTAKSDATMQNEKQKSSKETSFKVLLDNDHSNIKEKKYLVIKDADALKAIYAKINMTRRPGLPIPNINFNKEMVIGICLGEKSNAGYKISIEKIEDVNGETIVLYRENPPKGMAATVITQPCLLVATTKSDLPVKFVNALEK